MPDRATQERVEKARKSGRKGRRGHRHVVVDNISGSVNINDHSINLIGDDMLATLTGIAPFAQACDAAAELLGSINEAILEIHRSMKRQITPAELGRLAAPHHAAILAACKSPEEYPHAMEIMKIRLQKQLADEPAMGP